MAWVAFDRAVRSIEEFGLEGPLDRWRAIRSAIHAEVCEHGFDRRAKRFVQSFGATTLDASLLLIPLVGFLPADDPRVQGTVAAIERKLLRDGFVLRYDTGTGTDGLPPGEGAFLACSFWLADNYAMLGRYEEARAFSSDCWRCATTSVSWRRNTIQPAAASSAIFRRPSRISR